MTNQIAPDLSRKIVAEVISIGDEISTGAILDTNTQFLSQSLSEVGVRVLYHSTIGDNMDAMVVAFATAVRRADVVVVTGGLGPTQDDLTRQAVARVMGDELEFDPKVCDHIENIFKRRGRMMPESNKLQAYFPQKSQIISNPNGTAPGFIIERNRNELPKSFLFLSEKPKEGKFIFLSFPGVPAELKEMWKGNNGRDAVTRFVNRISGASPRFYRNKLIHTFGASESSIEEKLPNLTSRNQFPLVGITAKNSIITLRIFAEGSSENECSQQIEEVSRIIYSSVGEFIFGEDEDSFPEVVSHNLRAQCKKVGLFEWGTQGVLASMLDSDVLAFGRVFGESENKNFQLLFGNSSLTPIEERLFHKNQETFGAQFYTIRKEISEQLLRFCKYESSDQKVDYFLAVGPFPKITACNNSKLPTVDVVFIDMRNVECPLIRQETFVFGGHPAIHRFLFCYRALDMLRKYQ